MYIENNNPKSASSGRIEVICGSMFSGKTEELIRRINRVKIAQRHIEIFKPTVDHRYSSQDVVSHNKSSIEATPIENSSSILLLYRDADVVAIDEAQFFDQGIVDVCNTLANNGVRVIIAGLDMDYQGIPFGPMPALCAIADDVYKTRAVCVRCGQLANYSFRTALSHEQVLIGEKQEYMPLCRRCYNEAMQAKKQSEQ
jgi:thymidine kinase